MCQTMEANSIIEKENNKNLKKIGIFSDRDENSPAKMNDDKKIL